MPKSAPLTIVTAIKACLQPRPMDSILRLASPIWPTSSATCSDSAMRLADGGSSGVRAHNAATMSATIWKSHSRTPCAACPSTFRCRAWKNAAAAREKALSLRTDSPRAPSAAVRARSFINRLFYRCAAPATSPAGVDEGTQLRLSQEGQAGVNGGPPGDLYVVLKVKSHPIFERHEDNLHCTVPINAAQAALGASIDILTLDGLQTVKIPEGSQAGQRWRIKGIGVP